MKSKKIRFDAASPMVASLIAAAALFGPNHTHAAPLDIAQVPLYLGGTAAPNILFMLDDSSSMSWSYLPDDIHSFRTRRAATASNFNRIYYNPNVAYPPPLDQDGQALPNANFQSAWDDGYRAWANLTTATVDLGSQFRAAWYYQNTSDAYVDSSGRAAYYHVYDPARPGCADVTDDACYEEKTVGANEQQNFANWYSYYRTRILAAKAGASRAFAQMGTGIRVGYGKITKQGSNVDGQNMFAVERGVRDFRDRDAVGTWTGERTGFFKWLFELELGTGTPLRRALDWSGRYYERSDDQGPASTTPGVAGGKDLSCRKNFTILTTDGYWNSEAATTPGARDNNDGSDGPLITGPASATGQFLGVPPFSDNFSDTLADVAAWYYKRDLRPDLTNNVPVTPDNPAFWQHMVTLGIAFGVTGTVDPDDAYAAIATGTDLNWPDPGAQNTSARIDDLLHAAINSRGKFFSAAEPEAFADALGKTLATINSDSSTAAAVASNTTRLSSETLLYQATFNSGNWTGDILAFEIDQDATTPSGSPNPNYGRPKVTPKWKASDSIPLAASRNLVTYDSASQSGIDFTWNALNTNQKTALNNDADLLAWLRGDRSQELNTQGGVFRARASLMGDIVNSDPVAVGQEDYNYALAASLSDAQRNSYATRRSSPAFTARKGALFFGANDGVFRGIDAATGDELFGYIPNAILPDLPVLADPSYSHRYFVDGAPRVADALIGANWKTVLVGSTGAGGKAYFALDVENAHALTSNSVLWEISAATPDFAELGYAMGQAAIVRTESGHWVAIIGNGYNSNSQQARLFVVDLETGARLAEINTGVGDLTSPNGLATPIAVDADRDGSTDLVYAGDLRGNLWKFDFTGATIQDWKISFGGKPLFTATDKNGNVQPITSKPQVGTHADGGLIVYFGTGKYFETGDSADTTVQSLYGVRDECGIASQCDAPTSTAKVLRSNLLEQTITFEGPADFGGNSVEVRQFSQNSPTVDQRGFFVDLIVGSNAKGERILATPFLWSDRVIFVSAIPNEDACLGGGESWIIELSPETGGRTTFHPFDLAGDGSYGASNAVGQSNLPANARKVVGGMIKTLGQVRDKGKTHKYGATSKSNIDTSTQQNDSARRISWQQIQ